MAIMKIHVKIGVGTQCVTEISLKYVETFLDRSKLSLRNFIKCLEVGNDSKTYRHGILRGRREEKGGKFLYKKE